MMESFLKTLDSVKSINYNFNKMSNVLVSLCMVFPLVLGEFLPKALPDDLTLSVVCSPSSKEAAFKCLTKLLSQPYFHNTFPFSTTVWNI